MIELTVKTLDSQNHSFSVEDDITVAQFKEKIAATINIPADTQRIIYCGRVLQDDTKLNDYDVNGKVVHLVQRAPPALNQRSRPATPPPHRRHFRGPEHGNAMYLGSMAIPSSLLDTQNVIPPLPTHSLSASRLNVARRMLRRAETVLNALENPSSQNNEQPPQEEQQEEVTPVFEARVIVPSNASADPIDEALVLSAVQNSLLNVGAVPLSASQPIVLQEGSGQTEATDRNNLNVDDRDSPRIHSVSSTPGVVSPLAASTENIPNAADQEVNMMDTTTSEPAENTTTSEPAETTPSSAVAGASATANSSETTGNSSENTENISRTTEYADLLDSLNRFQIRFAPHLERYNNFMREDPAVPEENARQTQAFINRVSEILHFLGHAYHSLSDIIVRVRTPPPRPLLCRPILIQHSAVVQAGIPVQLEAQINISSDNNNAMNAQIPTSMPNATQEANSTTREPPTTTANNLINPTVFQPTVVHPTIVGFPVIPGAGSMRVQTIPVEIRGITSPRNISVALQRGNNNNNNNISMISTRVRATSAGNSTNSSTAGINNAIRATSDMSLPERVFETSTGTSTPSSVTTTTTATSTTSIPTTSATAAATTATAPPTAGSGGATSGTMPSGNIQGATFSLPGFNNNPNMEVFMEVTPESITIDSLETTFVGSGQANEFLRGAFNGPPPDLLNSIWQMAGQLVNRGMQPASTTTSNGMSTSTTAPSAPPPERSIPDSTPQNSTNLGATSTTMQNSQARGNTQTNPTTATHTRSTSRPHVHLAQHAMQGFDPFLPCNSHHVTPRRRFQTSQPNASAQSSQAPDQTRNEGTPEARANPVNNTVVNILQGIMNSIRNAYSQQQHQQQQQQQTQQRAPSQAQAGTANLGNVGAAAAVPSSGDLAAGAATGGLPIQLLQSFVPHLQNINLSDTNSSGPTIAELLQQFPDDSTPEGESLFSELINLFSRHLTVGDLIQLTNGRLEPLMRIRSSIRNFFLVRVLDGSQTTYAIDRGVNRIISEMQPLFEHLGNLPTRDDIDIVRSAQTLFRARLPNIISLAASRSPNSLRMLVDQCRITAKQLGALIMHASRNGQQGVESVIDSVVTYHTRGIPNDLQQWTLLTSRNQMRQFLSNLSVPESILQPYIVRKVDAVTSSVVSSIEKEQQDEEAMQVDDDQEASSSSELRASSINLTDDTEPLPAVVLGSEAWHGEVPADWVPIIARDAQRQRRQNSQAPFSDAYLSGMPSKRRKIVTSAKPQGSLPQVISESVRRAVTSTGLASVAPLEVVAQGAGADINIQSAYRELLRTNVRASLRGNTDFTPERFPNATNYFNNPQ